METQLHLDFSPQDLSNLANPDPSPDLPATCGLPAKEAELEVATVCRLVEDPVTAASLVLAPANAVTTKDQMIVGAVVVPPPPTLGGDPAPKRWMAAPPALMRAVGADARWALNHRQRGVGRLIFAAGSSPPQMLQPQSSVALRHRLRGIIEAALGRPAALGSVVGRAIGARLVAPPALGDASPATTVRFLASRPHRHCA